MPCDPGHVGLLRLRAKVIAVGCIAVVALFAACGPGSWSGGIGAVLRYHREPTELYVDRVPSGTAAARAGLTPHDRVLAIDGAPVATLDENQVREHVRGEVGTRVRLRVMRNGEERDVVIERAPYR